jgi:hypothetical protein
MAWGVPEEKWVQLAWWQRIAVGVYRSGEFVFAGVMGFLVVAVVGVLIYSLAYHAFVKGDLGHEEDGEHSPGVSRSINPRPEKLDGTRSYEFEPDDIERAENAPPSVQEYCEGAVSEAQEVGCLSHVDPSEVP